MVAPREGRDFVSTRTMQLPMVFQSTRPSRGATLADIVNAVKRVLDHQNLQLTQEQRAAARQAKTLQDQGGDATMGTTRNSLKEDLENGRKGAVGTGAYENLHGEERRADAREGEENPSFGAKPVRIWAEGHIMELAKGSCPCC